MYRLEITDADGAIHSEKLPAVSDHDAQRQANLLFEADVGIRRCLVSRVDGILVLVRERQPGGTGRR